MAYDVPWKCRMFHGSAAPLAGDRWLTVCSARDLTARDLDVGAEHALDVVEGLTVRMPRVHVEMLEFFSLCRHFRSCFFVSQFAE